MESRNLATSSTDLGNMLVMNHDHDYDYILECVYACG